jgi:hypothetical protein
VYFGVKTRLRSFKSIETEVIPFKAIKVYPLPSWKDLAAETHEVIRAAYGG